MGEFSKSFTSAVTDAAGSMTEKIRGYLTVSVAEASGKNKEDDIVWDGNFVEGFVKGPSSSMLLPGLLHEHHGQGGGLLLLT